MPVTYKPLPLKVSPINWNLSITNGLVFDWKNNARTPYVPINNVTKQKAVINGTATEILKRYGSGIDFGTTASYRWSDRNTFSAFNYMTVELIYIRDGGGSNGYGTLFNHGDDTTATPWFSIKNDNNDGGWGMRAETMYTNREKVWSSPYPSNGVLHHDIIVYDHTNKDNTPLWWRDGVPLTLTNRYDAGWVKTINANDVFVGDSFWTGGNEIWDGQIFLVRYWKRMLTKKEVYRLYENPSIIYTSDYRVLGKAPIVAGANLRRYSLPLTGMG